MTVLPLVAAKSILHKVRFDGSQWFGVDYTINIYRGCCHGCIYCDSRSACYRIDDFDTVHGKENAVELLEAELGRVRRSGPLPVVGMGSMSDPYNPWEKSHRLTRRALEAVNRRGFGIAVATKSDLVARDGDVLASMAERSAALVKVTVTAADDGLASRIEPHAPPPSARFKAIQALTNAGVFTGVLLMPVLPFLTDAEANIRAVVRLAAAHGARFVHPMFGVTLRENQREYFHARLEALFPGLKRQYVRQFGNSYLCLSPRAERLKAVLEAECEALGLLWRMADIIRAYKRTRWPVWQTIR